MANSAWADAYHGLLTMPLAIAAGKHALSLSVHQWINDGLMAIFFLLVGLELKREVLAGELASPRHAALPIAAALGGMIVPAAIYVVTAGGAWWGAGGRSPWPPTSRSRSAHWPSSHPWRQPGSRSS